jgi:hypothetical protein
MMDDVVARDADEFGAHVRAGGWRLGLLVARSVEKGEGNGRPPKNLRGRSGFAKVSAAQFARRSGTTHARVLRYLDAWERAAKAKLVPLATKLLPGAEIELPDPERWSEFYDASNAGGRPRDNTPEAAAKIVERHGVDAVINALPIERQIEVARRIARQQPTLVLDDPETFEAVEEAAIPLRARQQTPARPGRVERVVEHVERSTAKMLDDDRASLLLRSAVRDLARAIVEREEHPESVDEAKWRESCAALDRLLRIATEGGWSDDDRSFLDELGVLL